MSTRSSANKDGYLYCNFIEDYFYSLPSQGNIYTFVPLKNQNGCCKFLVATLQKKIFCMEYSSSGSYSLIEVPLSSIPNGADIISMNAISLNKTDIFTVGVSFCKKEGAEVTESFLNIYCNLDIHTYKETEIPISCCSINLLYMPYHLVYTYVATDINKSSPIWILCGSDSFVHLYKASKNNPNLYEEVCCLENGFPEFKQFQDITVRLDVQYDQARKSRLTAMCGDKGNIIIFNVDLTDLNCPKIKSKRQLNFDFPTSCSKFFKLNCFSPPLFSFLQDDLKRAEEESNNSNFQTLIVTTLESCFVHRDIDLDLSGFQLPQSENYDVVTCCLVCDVDFDGINEILLGTYGQTVLIYHLNDDEDNPWVLTNTLSFSSPVLSLAYEDFLGDGVKELIVHTMAGVHIYQHDPEEISSLLLERLHSIVDQKLAMTDGQAVEGGI